MSGATTRPEGATRLEGPTRLEGATRRRGTTRLQGATRLRAAFQQLRAAPQTGAGRDAATLVARLGLAWIFIYHGAATLFGAFGGAGVRRAALFFATVAHLHPGTLFAVVSGSLEFFGGIAVGLGIFGRIAAAGIALDMIGAMVTVTFRNGIASSAPGGGYELTLALTCLALVVASMGTGRFGLDMLLKGLRTKAPATRPPAGKSPAGNTPAGNTPATQPAATQPAATRPPAPLS